MLNVMKTNIILLVLLFGLFLTDDSVHAQTNLISNGSFEEGILDWVWRGTIDIVSGGWLASDGSHSIDLNGIEPGAIRQAFSTDDRHYQVIFDMAGNPDGPPSNKALRVLVAPTFGDFTVIFSGDFTFDTTGKSRINMDYEGNSFIFTATSNYTDLGFESLTPGPFGPVIDNVRIHKVESMFEQNLDTCFDTLTSSVQPLVVPSLISGTTNQATIDDNTIPCDTEVTAPGVWYTVIGTGNIITASTCNQLTNYDTKISVYGTGCNNLTCITGNDDGSPLNIDPDPACVIPGTGSEFNRASTVSWCSQLGIRYWILVHGYEEEKGSFELGIYDNGMSCPKVQGACCTDSTCSIRSKNSCLFIGGDYQGHDTKCTAIPNLSGYPEVIFGDLIGPWPIPDNDPDGILHEVYYEIFPEESFIIGDIDFDMALTHPYIGDLTIDIEHEGVSQRIWNRKCSDTDNIVAIANDQGISEIEFICDYIAGEGGFILEFSPEATGLGPLSVFNGMDAAGSWSIRISDNASADIGTLDQWALRIHRNHLNPCPIIVNDLVSLIHLETFFDDQSYFDDPIPSAPAGKFLITAFFRNASTTILNPFFNVAELSGGNMLLNANSFPGNVGATLTPNVSDLDEWGNIILWPRSFFEVEFIIGLQERKPFRFYVDLLGVPDP